MDIANPADPRVRVEFTFHPKTGAPVTVSLPRWDFLDEATMRNVKAALRRFKQDQERQQDDIRRAFNRYRIDVKRHAKTVEAWEKLLDDPECDDPGPAPELPARPVFDDPPDGYEVDRMAALFIFKEVVTAAQYKVLEKCTTGELMQAKAQWDKHSEIPLGELLASPISSTPSTEGPSAPTSSPADGPDATSGNGSRGLISVTS